MKAISLQQPWAWAILHAGKDVENRRWNTRYRGPIAIHASAKPQTDYDWPRGTRRPPKPPPPPPKISANAEKMSSMPPKPEKPLCAGP